MKTSILKVKDPNTGAVHSVPALKGESAYEAAVKGGFIGTKEEFYKQLAQSTNNTFEEDDIVVKYKGIVDYEFNIQHLEKKKGNLYLFTGGDYNTPPYTGIIYDGQKWQEFHGYRQPSAEVKDDLIEHPSGAAVVKYVKEQIEKYDEDVMKIIGKEG